MEWTYGIIMKVLLMAASGAALSVLALAACRALRRRKDARLMCAPLKCAAFAYLLPAALPLEGVVSGACAAGGRNTAVIGIAFGIWCAGMAVSASAQAVRLHRFRRLLRARLPVRWEEYMLLTDLRRQMGIRKKVEIYRCYGILSPCIHGVRKPKVFLPVIPLGEEQLEMIFYHELLHVKRRDLLWKKLFVLLSIVFWFVPFLRSMLTMLCRCAEADCDARCCEHYSARRYFKMMGELLVKAGDAAPECVSRCGGGMEEFCWRAARMIRSAGQEK